MFAGSLHGAGKHANIISVKVLGVDESGSLAWLLAGLDWIQRHINAKTNNAMSVINMSFGIHDIGGELYFLDTCFADIGAVIVAAAGNEYTNACYIAPASFRSVISVGATTIDDSLLYIRKAKGTNIGPCVDILAPGDRIFSASHFGTKKEAIKTGTSMAAAYVSGVVARYMQNFTRQPSSADMRRMLQETATQGKTNAALTYTSDLIVHAGCASGKVVPGIVKGSSPYTKPCFPYLPPTEVTPAPSVQYFPQHLNMNFVIFITLGVSLAVIGVLLMFVERRHREKCAADRRKLLYSVSSLTTSVNPKLIVQHEAPETKTNQTNPVSSTVKTSSSTHLHKQNSASSLSSNWI